MYSVITATERCLVTCGQVALSLLTYEWFVTFWCLEAVVFFASHNLKLVDITHVTTYCGNWKRWKIRDALPLEAAYPANQTWL